MQILERLRMLDKLNKKRFDAQNLIEFAFVLTILLFLTLCIFEVALFWQDTNAIYALNTEINANAALIDPKNMALGTRCTAAEKAIEILQSKDKIISINDPAYINPAAPADTNRDFVIDGYEPFALYKYVSNGSLIKDNNGNTHPQVTMWVDCRNPFENGVTTQIEFFHKNLIIHAAIPRFDGEAAIVLIPENIFIASPKLNTIRHY